METNKKICCPVCGKANNDGIICKTCGYLILFGLFGFIPGIVVVVIAEKFFGLPDKSRYANEIPLFPVVFTFIVLFVRSIWYWNTKKFYILPKGFIGFLIIIGFFALIVLVPGRHGRIEAKQRTIEAERFESIVKTAMKYNQEVITQDLSYPDHSMLVCQLGFSDSTFAKQWAIEGGISRYHYDCPSKWLATLKDSVKVVVLIEEGATTKIGDYVPSGGAAYSTVYELRVVDMKGKAIVAKHEFISSDPASKPSFSSFDHYSWPIESEVERVLKTQIKSFN